MYAKQYDLKLVKAPFDIPPIELQMQMAQMPGSGSRARLVSGAIAVGGEASAVYATSYSTDSFTHFVLRLLQPTVVPDDVFCQLHLTAIRTMYPLVSRKHPKVWRPLPRLAPVA